MIRKPVSAEWRPFFILLIRLTLRLPMSRTPAGSNSYIFTAVRDMYCVLARNTTILHLSPCVVQLTGHHPHALIGCSFFDLVHGDDALVFADEFSQAAAFPNHVFRFYARIRTAFDNPTHAAFELHGHFHLDCSGHLPALASVKGIFIFAARPAFLSNSTQIDLFLELKTEEEALKHQIAALRDEDSEAYGRAEANFAHPCPSDADIEHQKHCTSTCQPETLRGQVLVRGDANILYSPKPSDKVSKRRKATPRTEFICAWCNTTSAPEWRRGPDGPKTLCNACGRRFPISCVPSLAGYLSQ